MHNITYEWPPQKFIELIIKLLNRSTSLTINWYSLSPKIDKAISIHTASLRELRACEQWHSPVKRYLANGND